MSLYIYWSTNRQRTQKISWVPGGYWSTTRDTEKKSVQPQSTHTEWRRPLSCVHSIMMEKLAYPPILYFPSRTKLIAVYAPAEKADTPPLFHLYPCVLCEYNSWNCTPAVQSVLLGDPQSTAAPPPPSHMNIYYLQFFNANKRFFSMTFLFYGCREPVGGLSVRGHCGGCQSVRLEQQVKDILHLYLQAR